VLAATCALIVMGFLSMGFFVSVGGLVIAWTVAFMAGTGAAAVVEPAHSGRNASVVVFYFIGLVAVYFLILPALAGPVPPGARGGRVSNLAVLPRGKSASKRSSVVSDRLPRNVEAPITTWSLRDFNSVCFPRANTGCRGRGRIQSRHDRLEIGPDRFRDPASARGVRMHSVRGRELGVEEEIGQKEWNKRNAVFLGQTKKQPVEFERVTGRVKGRRLHGAQQDTDSSLLRAFDDLCEVPLDCRYPYTIESIVGAKLHDEHINVAGQRGVEPPDAVGRRIAVHARVDNLGRYLPVMEECFQDGRKTLRARGR
jgi:hypothetical protein